jgi:hypothetical protein
MISISPKLEPLPDITEDDGKPAAPRHSLQDYLVNHSDTLGMTWQEIEALRPPFVIDGIARQGELVLLGAESKSRKSWLAQDAGFAVAAGIPWLPDEDGNGGLETVKARVHVLDLELNDSEVRFRFAKARGNRFAGEEWQAEDVTRNISTYCLDGLGVVEIMPLLTELEDSVSPGDLVVIDCLYRLVPDGTETAEVAAIMERIKLFAKRTQGAVIMIDHFRKAGDDKARNRFAGSFVKQAAPSTLIAIESKGDILTLNIDARTFHGMPTVNARFNLDSYAFESIPAEQVAAIKDSQEASVMRDWLVKAWAGYGIGEAVTNAMVRGKWSISRPATDARFDRLTEKKYVEIRDNKSGHAKSWVLTPKGVALVEE